MRSPVLDAGGKNLWKQVWTGNQMHIRLRDWESNPGPVVHGARKESLHYLRPPECKWQPTNDFLVFILHWLSLALFHCTKKGQYSHSHTPETWTSIFLAKFNQIMISIRCIIIIRKVVSDIENWCKIHFIWILMIKNMWHTRQALGVKSNTKCVRNVSDLYICMYLRWRASVIHWKWAVRVRLEHAKLSPLPTISVSCDYGFSLCIRVMAV